MDGIVGPERHAYEIFEVKYVLISSSNLFGRHWIHVVDVDPIVDLKPLNSQITA